MTDIQFNGITLSLLIPEAEVLVVERDLVGGRRNERVDIPGRAGSLLFAEEPGDRRISFEIDIQTSSFGTRRAAVRELANWCDVRGRARLIIGDEPDRFHDCALMTEPSPSEWLVGSQISLAFEATPYAQASAVSTDIEQGAPPLTSSILNDGDVTVLPVIQIDPNGTGELADMTIQHNGQLLTIENTFNFDQIVTVNSISQTVTTGASGDSELTGAFDQAAVHLSGVSGVFPYILADDVTPTDIIVTNGGTATDLIVTTQFRRLYR